MIWDSSYWKEDLGRLADKLKARKVQKKFPERSLACLEKEIFIGCYIIRKLIDAKKLSDSIVSLKLSVRFHSSIGKNQPGLLGIKTSIAPTISKMSKPNLWASLTSAIN